MGRDRTECFTTGVPGSRVSELTEQEPRACLMVEGIVLAKEGGDVYPRFTPA
jgi:hypothetical protein